MLDQLVFQAYQDLEECQVLLETLDLRASKATMEVRADRGALENQESKVFLEFQVTEVMLDFKEMQDEGVSLGHQVQLGLLGPLAIGGIQVIGVYLDLMVQSVYLVLQATEEPLENQATKVLREKMERLDPRDCLD